MGISVVPTGDLAAVITEMKDAVAGFDTNITAIKTETDKMPATITKVDAIKVETDKVPATIEKVDLMKTEIDKTPATIDKIDLAKDALELKVVSATPEEAATDVAVDTTVTVVFNRHVMEAFDNDDLKDKVSVVDADSTSYDITSAVITDDTLVVTITGDLANEKVVTFVLDKDGIVGENNSGKMEENFTLEFTTVA